MGRRCAVLNCRHSNGRIHENRCTVFKLPSIFKDFEKCIKLTGNEGLAGIKGSTLLKTIGICKCHYDENQIVGKGKNRRPLAGQFPSLKLPANLLSENIMQVVRRHNDLKKLSLKAVNEEKSVNLNSESTEVDDVPRSGNYIKNNLSATFHDVSLPLMNEITTSTDIPQDPVCLSIDNHPGVLDATSMLIENDLTNIPQDSEYLTTDDHPGISVDATSTSIENDLANSGRSSPVTKELTVQKLQKGRWGSHSLELTIDYRMLGNFVAEKLTKFDTKLATSWVCDILDSYEKLVLKQNRQRIHKNVKYQTNHLQQYQLNV